MGLNKTELQNIDTRKWSFEQAVHIHLCLQNSYEDNASKVDIGAIIKTAKLIDKFVNANHVPKTQISVETIEESEVDIAKDKI
jgi:hypothetical protein